jgi:hypothetical protein
LGLAIRGECEVPGMDIPTRPGLKTPRAAAVAGILFSVFFLAALILILESVEVMPTDPGAWLASDSWKIALALHLIPFSGISFLWFIGVLRDKMGEAEDRLFATVFLGSGLLIGLWPPRGQAPFW